MWRHQLYQGDAVFPNLDVQCHEGRAIRVFLSNKLGAIVMLVCSAVCVGGEVDLLLLHDII